MSVEVLKLTGDMVVVIATILCIPGALFALAAYCATEYSAAVITMAIMLGVALTASIVYWVLHYKIIAMGIV